jgi:hypothetical protein
MNKSEKKKGSEGKKETSRETGREEQRSVKIKRENDEKECVRDMSMKERKIKKER